MPDVKYCGKMTHRAHKEAVYSVKLTDATVREYYTCEAHLSYYVNIMMTERLQMWVPEGAQIVVDGAYKKELSR